MADTFLLRNIPDELQVWLNRESRDRGMSRQEFIMATLARAYETDLADKAPLLATILPSMVANCLPINFVGCHSRL